jgi:DNA-binding transcriptional ArsR family regulator
LSSEAVSAEPRRARPRQGRKPARELAEIDEVVSALAHESRRHILLVVRFRGGEMTAGQIAERFSCAWPTVSRHLRVLERAGLLVHEKKGRSRVYRLNRRKLKVLKDWLRWFEGKSP